ncbi:MAG: ArnT family glycosyltransferase [Bryobacteraceae bacterium]
MRFRALAFWLVVVFSCLRFAHVHLLWADEDYHVAAAINVLHGKVPYRDFWYDKPPLSALYYVLIGGHWGWLLRLLDAVYVLVACGICYRLSKLWWGETEALISACLVSFFLAFYLPSAVIPFAADAVMLVPHLLALYSAARGRYFWAGIWAGVAFLANIKALFVLAAAGLWALPEVAPLAIGFVIPVAIGSGVLLVSGAWPGYIEQVWRWGFVYASGSPVAHPWINGLLRTANWAGFHSGLAIAAVVAVPRLGRSLRWKLGTWIVVSYLAVALGGRFAPHYFLQLLPPVAVLGSFGMVRLFQTRRRVLMAAVALAFAVPFVRFGPRYITLAADDLRGRDPRWSDVVMDVDSQDVARRISATARAGDTLFVWGYRPDIFVYTRMVSDSRFWDSQPLTGVAADRHLYATTAIYGGPSVANRMELTHSSPIWVVDGLGLLNSRLAPDRYPEVRDWLAHYTLIGRTKLSLIYHRK